jgi:hypothetical protein
MMDLLSFMVDAACISLSLSSVSHVPTESSMAARVEPDLLSEMLWVTRHGRSLVAKNSLQG